MLYRRKIPADKVVTQELARTLAESSAEINRQVGILLTRKGEVDYVIVGDHKKIVIPELTRLRASTTRLKGLRLIHTHLNQEPLTHDDLTDLALLRLDLVAAIGLEAGGFPGKAFLAHLLPENPANQFWTTLDPVAVPQIDIDFQDFIQALEEEFVRSQRTRKVEAENRAILVRIDTGRPDEDQYAIEELRELAASSGVQVFDAFTQRRPQPDPKYVLGKGKLSELVIKALQIGANLLIFDCELTPAQVRSISECTELKVIDRTQLILDIFAQRAHSREGKIQVELAQLRYLLPRLTEKNTAMSRLTGGIGGRGPGETKLEINRRRTRDRITHLEQDLVKVRKDRGQRRLRRERHGLPVISIVGYTNAGKSTLLNTLTQSDVLAENRLFATLDPKSARLRFPRDTEAIITDTVGFIRSLPQELMDAFRSTLEELNDADILLHIIDISNPDFENQMTAVEKILQDLDLQNKPVIRIFNKADRFADKKILAILANRFQAIPLSAIDRKTLAPLLNKLEMITGGCG